MMEVFSLPHTLGRKAMRQNPTQSGLYAWLDKQLDKADTEVALEHLSVLRVRSGQRSKVEEIVEYPRPTEFDPPHIPQYYSPTPPTIPPAPPTPAPTPNPTPTPTPAPMPAPAPAPTPAGAHGEVGTCGPECSPGSKSPSKPWPYTPTTPTSFEIRNIGWTTEAELNINDDGKTADLNIAPEFSKLIARLPIGINEEIILPVFETQKLAAQIFATVGKPTLIGSMNPPIGTGVNGSNDDNRVWFLYVTVIQPE